MSGVGTFDVLHPSKDVKEHDNNYIKTNAVIYFETNTIRSFIHV